MKTNIVLILLAMALLAFTATGCSTSNPIIAALTGPKVYLEDDQLPKGKPMTPIFTGSCETDHFDQYFACQAEQSGGSDSPDGK